MLSEQNEKLRQVLEETQTLLQASKQQEAVFESKTKILESSLSRSEDRIASLQNEMLFSAHRESRRSAKSAEDKQDA